MDNFFNYDFFKSLAELYKDLTGVEVPEKTIGITFPDFDRLKKEIL